MGHPGSPKHFGTLLTIFLFFGFSGLSLGLGGFLHNVKDAHHWPLCYLGLKRFFSSLGFRRLLGFGILTFWPWPSLALALALP